ncbi:MAG: efflux RND transporter permease subunit [Treponema sp.]
MALKTHLCKKLYERPRLLLCIILAITFFFGVQLISLRFDNNNFRFIPETDAAHIANEEIAHIFGNALPILIGIERKYTSVVDKTFLTHLQALDKKLLQLPLVQQVVSLTNTQHIDAIDDAIISKKLVPNTLTGSPEEYRTITRKLRSWDLYNRNLISDDLKATQILVFLDVRQDESGLPKTIEVCRSLIALTEAWDCPDTKTYITGIPIFSEIITQATKRDLMLLIPIVILAVTGILFVSFKRFTGVLLPLLTVLISCIWAFGAMALCRIPLSILSTILPVILIAVGSAYGIHIINHYFDNVTQNSLISKEEHTIQITMGMERLLPPLFLAGITTFAGFVSFCFTPVVPIFEFGLFSSFGVLSAFVISITLIPSILILRGPRNHTINRFRAAKNSTDLPARQLFDTIVADTFMIFHRRWRTVCAAVCACIVFSISGISKLVIDNILMEYFAPDTPIVQSDRFIQEKFGGSKLLTMLITTDKPEDVVRPDVLQALDDLTEYAAVHIPEIGKITSIVDLLKRLNQVTNADSPAAGISPSTAANSRNQANDTPEDFGTFGFDTNAPDTAEPAPKKAVPSSKADEPAYRFSDIVEKLVQAEELRPYADIRPHDIIALLKKEINYKGSAYYEIPTDPAKYGKHTQQELTAIIQNYLLLLAGNTDTFIDDIYAPKALKVTVQLNTIGQHDTNRAVAALMDYIHTTFPQDVRAQFSGTVLIEQSLNALVVKSQLISLAISLGIVFLILTIYYRSFIIGVIGVIPLLISIALNFGFMGFMNIKLNIGTAMVASFAIGIGIDYTIHYLAAYQHAYLYRKERENIILTTFYSCGKAILFNAISVGAGFAVLMLSTFNILADLGFLIALVMITSSLTSLIVLPILLSAINPHYSKPVRKLPFLNRLL